MARTRQRPKTSFGSSNGRYAAFLLDHEIYIRSFLADEQLELLGYQICKRWSSISLSPSQQTLLAVSDDSQIRIFDVASRGVKQCLPGVGRSVTTLDWSPHNESLLAAGLIDGGICIWDLENPLRPLYHLNILDEPCRNVAFNGSTSSFLASAHGSRLHFWDLRRSLARPVTTIFAGRSRFCDLLWHPESTGLLATLTEDRMLRIYDLSSAIPKPKDIFPRALIRAEDDDDDEDNFGVLKDIADEISPSHEFPMDTQPKNMRWCGENGLLGLDVNGLQASLYAVQDGNHGVTNVWTCELDFVADAVLLLTDKERTSLIAVGRNGREIHQLSKDEVDGIRLLRSLNDSHATGDSDPNSSGRSHHHAAQASSNEDTAFMNPQSISGKRAANGFEKTSRQLRHRRRHQFASRSPRSHARRRLSKESATPPQMHSMTSSLELPEPTQSQGNGVLMRLPSPIVQSRRVLGTGLASLEENTGLLPDDLPTAVEHTSPIATPSNDHDSDDSDDESFVNAMRNSKTFLPGGINVPLPKACGALFAPNGQLVTFFPPRPKTPPWHHDEKVEEPTQQKEQAHKVARLFPTFGNVFAARRRPGESFDSDDSSATESEQDEAPFEVIPTFAFQPSSFPNQHSWKAKISPRKTTFVDDPGPHKILISVYDLGFMPKVCSNERYLAGKYRLLCKEDESSAKLCNFNAGIADEAGIPDTASMWRLLGLLLEDKVPLRWLSDATPNDDVLVIARQASLALENKSGFGLPHSAQQAICHGKIRFAEHPLGAAWLVQRMLEWAERRADVQMLACISSVLNEAPPTASLKNIAAQEEMTMKLPTFTPNFASDAVSTLVQQRSTYRPVPVLRADSSRSNLLQESPTKIQRTSSAVFRNSSQPATPYFGSNSSTPPFTPYLLSRQASRLSTSGSASPEAHRGSFSAAAKYYAQTITDKFSSYGTSPPFKKPGTSPGTPNELSGSLPIGSWNKSVSFASTTGTARGSSLSRSYDEQDREDGYDSDKTIEDRSVPHTSRTRSSPIIVKMKHPNAFVDDCAGGTKATLIPEAFVVRCQLWREYYCEQLRCWNLLLQAAELEKVSGLSGGLASSMTGASTDENGILPITSAALSDLTCSICYTIIRGMEQICTTCLHISHLACLQEYVAELGDEAYECPAGCGCSCSEIPFVVEEAL